VTSEDWIAMNDGIVIKVDGLSKAYKLYEKNSDRIREILSPRKKVYHKLHYALKDISFEVKKGENVGIIGVNGSGKSTLLKILTGVAKQTSGTVVVNGKVSALLELGTGFNPEYTGMENIYLNGAIMGYTREEIDAKIPSILEFAGIGEFINQPVKTYSSGMFARLAFAVAVNVEPEILIVDEVLAVGDTRFQIKCMERMKEMMTGGTTVLFVSHDINAVRRFCSSAIWLNQGSIVRFGEVNSVADEYLDFLKSGEEFLPKVKKEDNKLPEFCHKDSIAEIIAFNVRNSRGELVSEFRYDEPIEVEVIYDVYNTDIPDPVLGVAVLRIDDDYVCGLNTLLDHVTIPWEYGRNRFKLYYTHGIRAIGGRYYFDAALFEQTATVAIQYCKRIKEFTILPEYSGEGRYIIPHVWRCAYE
jgi:lipopolysaccharide transport system ATP-binding protein/teichoic acid transport system ATP-binding protein